MDGSFIIIFFMPNVISAANRTFRLLPPKQGPSPFTVGTIELRVVSVNPVCNGFEIKGL